MKMGCTWCKHVCRPVFVVIFLVDAHTGSRAGQCTVAVVFPWFLRVFSRLVGQVLIVGWRVALLQFFNFHYLSICPFSMYYLWEFFLTISTSI